MKVNQTRYVRFVCGHELDEVTAAKLFDVVRISVPRVVEAMAIDGRKDGEIKAAAITTVAAIAGAFAETCKERAKTEEKS
ncbi:hypothetical protein [Serratia ureilytica]|uniref:Uncharacterized protein n=1 Tax=Serratia ureilytica TaxID=300181 RepID=A0A9X9BXC1_9GAMM|nr:hypothetical protein [Serratia ureilytica]TXE22177.1 hypothetical protein FOT63_25685 [Serratia ureilytica]